MPKSKEKQTPSVGVPGPTTKLEMSTLPNPATITSKREEFFTITPSKGNKPIFKNYIFKAGKQLKYEQLQNLKLRTSKKKTKKRSAKPEKNDKYFECYLTHSTSLFPKVVHVAKNGFINFVIRTEKGQLDMTVSVEDDKALFIVMNKSKSVWPKWADKEMIVRGEIGDVKSHIKPQKSAKAKIKHMRNIVSTLLNPLDAFTDDSYDKETGDPKHNWRTYPAIKGVPIHCKCGKHKSKNGQYTCKDLHDAMEQARGSLQL